MVVYHSTQLLEIGCNVNAVVDVIFISSLVNPIRNTWKAPGDTDWFKDRLPQRLLMARTLLYQYQGRQMTLADTVTDAATELLAEWDTLNAREVWGISRDSILGNVVDQPSRPVIFVCHGLGGLVVKKALLWAEAQRETPLLFRRTLGFLPKMFIGTPHAPEIQSLAQSQRRDSFIRDDSTPELEAIGLEHLSQISLAFPRVGELYMGANFCKSPCPGTCVLHSDCLWATVSRYRISQCEDKHWVLSEHFSQDMIGSNIEDCINCMTEAAVRISQDLHDLLASGQAMKEKYSKERLDNTGEWLLALDSYRTWIGTGEPSLLWLHGSLGTGKSTFCSAIIDDLRSCGKETDLVIYCFLEDAPGQPDFATYILRTITYQFRQHPASLVPDHILRSVLKAIQSEPNRLTLGHFQTLLRAVLRAINGQARIYLVIDGIGTANGTISVLVDEIFWANLSRRSSKRLRCAISTRASFQATLREGTYLEIDLSNEPAVQRDLKTFAVHRLTNYPLLSSSPESLSTAYVAEQLCSRANGSFLWIALAAENLQQRQSISLAPTGVEYLPYTVEDFYQMKLAKISASDVGIAQSVFSWLTVATRALHVMELFDALNITTDTNQSDLYAETSVTKDMVSRLQKRLMLICRGLVVVNDTGYVNFRHPSVREHLLYSTPKRSAQHALYQAHEHVARKCLILLNSKDETKPSIFCINSLPACTTNEGQSLCLQDYAAANWSFHYGLAESHSKILAGTLQRYLFKTLNHASDCFSISCRKCSIQIPTTILRICAHYGFVSLTQLCLEMGVNPDGGACRHCDTPLAIAAAGGHAPVAILLLRKDTADIRNATEKILHLTVAHGSLQRIEQLLLTRGGAPNAFDPHSGMRPLLDAAASEHHSLVKLLMSSGADIDATVAETQETPLDLAALHGKVAMVKDLIHAQEASNKEVEHYDRIVEQPYLQAWTKHVLRIDEESSRLSCEIRPMAEAYTRMYF